MWIDAASVSSAAHGSVRQVVRSTRPVVFVSWTGWLGESIEPRLTAPGYVTVAVRFLSQLAGPLKWTTQGVPGHAAAVLVMLQPGAAWALTCTGTSLPWTYVSMATLIGNGFWTETSVIVDFATTFSWALPGFECDTSTVAVKHEQFLAL